MKNKKERHRKAIRVGLTMLVVAGGIGVTLPGITPAKTYANVVVKQGEVENKPLLNLETVWRYLDNNVDPANGDVEKALEWTNDTYDVSTWKLASGAFGAKKGSLADLGNGTIPDVLLNQYYEEGKDISTYFFRTDVHLDNADTVKALVGTMKADDGVIVYLNGTKVVEENMQKNGVVSEPNMYYAGVNGGSPAEIQLNIDMTKFPGVLKEGSNTIAVELHNDRETSSDIYFELRDLSASYVAEDVDTVTQKAVSLTVGSDETQRNLTWYANTADTGEVQVAKKGSDGVFPEAYQSYVADCKQSADEGFYSNQVTIDKLEEQSEYVYRVVNGQAVSETYSFTTKNFTGAYNFIFAGDPQIGSSGSVTSDAENWNDTLQKAVTQFQPDFLITAGDQVNKYSAEDEYAGYLGAEVLSSLPTATTIGNHDTNKSSSPYQDHFNLPNENNTIGATPAGGDYWYIYNNTLFMDLNTNNISAAEHKAFMEDAIAKNPDVRWKTVIFHQSVYSTASHINDDNIIKLRETLPPIFTELDIDIVLQGHDHVYTRSYMMDGVVADTTNGVQSSVTDPTGTLYLTANSASGSKYYDITAPDAAFAAKMDQSRRRTISNIEVRDNQYTLTTYYVDDMSVLDTFTVNKTPQTNTTEEVLTPTNEGNVSLNVSVTVPAGALEKGASITLKEVLSGQDFQTIYNEVMQIFKEAKEFKVLSLDVNKAGEPIELTKAVDVTFDIPETYLEQNIKLYRYSTLEKKSGSLEEVSYTLKDHKIVVHTDQLGTFVIVHNSTNDDSSGGDESSNPSVPETTPEGTTPTPDATQTNTAGQGTASTITPSTGDTSNVLQLGVLCILALGCGLFVVKKAKQ